MLMAMLMPTIKMVLVLLWGVLGLWLARKWTQ